MTVPDRATDTRPSDAYSPFEIAERVRDTGVSKANTNAWTLFVLAVLAGAFISLGAAFFITVVTGAQLGYGINRLLGGVAFSLGLIMIVIGGGELFTGNNLVSMAWASRLISTRQLVRNWTLAYAGNVVGALGTAGLIWLADLDRLAGGDIGQTAHSIGEAKADLGFVRSLALGVLCNALVCMAVWLAMGGRSVTDKVLAIVLPVAAFVALGFEHSIANWFFLPYSMALDGNISLAGSALNLFAVTMGNMLGGTLLVAGVYWVAYLRDGKRGAGSE